MPDRVEIPQVDEFALDDLCTCGHTWEDHSSSREGLVGLLGIFTSNKDGEGVRQSNITGCLHSKDYGNIGDMFCPCIRFNPRPVRIAVPNSNLAPLEVGRLPDRPLALTTYGRNWSSSEPSRDIEEAQRWLHTRTGLYEMSINRYKIEDLLIAYAQYAGSEIVARMEQIVQERVALELERRASKIPAISKKNSRKFRPTEV